MPQTVDITTLIDQSGIVFTPEVLLGPGQTIFRGGRSEFLDPIARSRYLFVQEPTNDQFVDPSLIDNSGVVFDPVLSIPEVPFVRAGGGYSRAVKPQLFFINKPQTVSIGLIDQSGTTFDPVVIRVSTVIVGLIDQSGVTFTPDRIFESRLYMDLINQSGVVFDPIIQGGIQQQAASSFFFRMERG